MGIYERDWYKKQPEERFRLSESEKEKRLKGLRKAFSRFTDSIEKNRSGPSLRHSPSMPSTGKGSFLPRHSTLNIVLIWLSIGAFSLAGFDWLNKPKVVQTQNRIELIIPSAQDGHHYVEGMINGHPVKFLIDTGATYVAVSSSLAHQLGLENGELTSFQTANGKVNGQLVRNQQITVAGLLVPPLTIGIVPNAQQLAVLGQNFMRHVEMVQAERTLIIKGKAGALPPYQAPALATQAVYAGTGFLCLALLLNLLKRSLPLAQKTKMRYSEARTGKYQPATLDERLLLACGGDEDLARRLIETEFRRAPRIDELEAINRALKHHGGKD